MPNTPSIEERLERAEAKLQELLDRHRRLEDELRWADDRRNALRRWCDEVDSAIADSSCAVRRLARLDQLDSERRDHADPRATNP